MINLNELPDLLTTKEVAELTRCSIQTVKRWVRTGRLRCVKLYDQRTIRYPKEDIKKFLGL